MQVWVLRGLLRGRQGWISGTLEDRRARGITKAIVHSGRDVELLELANLAPDRQLALALEQPNKNTAGAMPAALIW